MRHGQRRVTLDLDDARKLTVLRGYYGLLDAGASDVEVRVSSSGTGYHVRGWFDDLDDESVEALRRTYGDHPIRIDLDDSHYLKPKQMLFTSKPSGRAGPWHSNPYDAIDEREGGL